MSTQENKPENIFQKLIASGQKKVIAYIRSLDAAGQIDHDGYGEPYVTRLDDGVGGKRSRKRVIFLRNSTLVNALLNTGRRTDGDLPHVESTFPVDFQSDGWTRPATVPLRLAPPASRGERQRRQSSVLESPRERYLLAMEGIIDDRA